MHDRGESSEFHPLLSPLSLPESEPHTTVRSTGRGGEETRKERRGGGEERRGGEGTRGEEREENKKEMRGEGRGRRGRERRGSRGGERTFDGCMMGGGDERCVSVDCRRLYVFLQCQTDMYAHSVPHYLQ